MALQNELMGKVVMITGASSGIGEITARYLAAAGAQVVLGARRVERLEAIADEIAEMGGEAVWYETDVTVQEDLEGLVEEALDAFGQIDVMINNAGLMPLSFLRNVKVDEWSEMVDVNIKGVLYGMAAVIPTMLEQGYGHIINMASVAAHSVFPTGAVYCATKHAVRAVTDGLFQELGGVIKATLISPGPVDTELLDRISSPRLEESMREIYSTAIEPEAVARAVLYAIAQPDDVTVGEVIIRPSKAGSVQR
jgi:NADP-dependent 3-hydroxy acid dehydrogenase YdfG